MATRRQLESEVEAALASPALRVSPGLASRAHARPARAGARTLCRNSSCSNRTMATAGYCQGCKSKRHHAHRRIVDEKLAVDTVGGSWWIWDASGDVLVMGKDTKADAIDALAFGDDVNDDDGDDDDA